MHYVWADEILSVIILTAVIATLNSAFFVCSRVLHRLAMHGDAPASLVLLNDRHVPSRSVVICALAGVIGVTAATVSPLKVFAFLVNTSSAVIVFIYMLVTAAYIKHRCGYGLRPGDGAASNRTPWSGYVAFAGLLGILAAMALTPGLQREFTCSLVTLLVIAMAYRLLRARGAIE
jgi:GABA permease